MAAQPKHTREACAVNVAQTASAVLATATPTHERKAAFVAGEVHYVHHSALVEALEDQCTKKRWVLREAQRWQCQTMLSRSLHGHRKSKRRVQQAQHDDEIDAFCAAPSLNLNFKSHTICTKYNIPNTICAKYHY